MSINPTTRQHNNEHVDDDDDETDRRTDRRFEAVTTRQQQQTNTTPPNEARKIHTARQPAACVRVCVMFLLYARVDTFTCSLVHVVFKLSFIPLLLFYRISCILGPRTERASDMVTF